MTLRFYEKFYYPFSHFSIFDNMFPENHGFVAVPVTSSNNFFSIHKLDIDIYIEKCKFDTSCNRHSNETVTFKKQVTKYKNMRKWMIYFFKKSESRRDKISRVNSIRFTTSINLLFCKELGTLMIKGDFPCTAHL